MKTKRPTTAELLARIEALEARVAALDARNAVAIWSQWPTTTENGVPYWVHQSQTVCNSTTTAKNTITA